MNRSKAVTTGLFLLSLMVVVGGWYLTFALLEQRMGTLLDRNGKILLQSQEVAFVSPENETAGGKDGTGDVSGAVSFQGQTVSEEMMAKVLAVWERGGRVLPHEPRQGQMNMEQAIEAGKEWIAAMAERGVIPAISVEGGFDNVTARLCTMEAANIDENLISYWDMRFTTDNLAIDFTLHAVSGEVWIASIMMNERECRWNEFRQEDLLKFAFPFVGEGKQILADIEGNVTSVSLPEGLVSASVRRAKIQISGKELLEQISFELHPW